MPVFKIEFQSYYLSRAQTVNIYVPNGYTGEYKDLNVVFLLHGMGGFQESWLYLGNAIRTADKYGVALIMPAEENSYGLMNKSGCDYEAYLMQEVYEYTHKWLNFSKEKSKNFIAGLSMGGYMAINLALKYPNHFNYVGAFSPVADLNVMSTNVHHDLNNPFVRVLYGVFGGIDMSTSDLNPINLAAAKKPFPRLYLYCGQKDGLYPGCKKLYNLLKEYDQDVEFYEDDGDHTWDRWEEQLQRFLERI